MVRHGIIWSVCSFVLHRTNHRIQHPPNGWLLLGLPYAALSNYLRTAPDALDSRGRVDAGRVGMGRPRKVRPDWNALATIWTISDELWDVIAPILAEVDPPKTTGRQWGDRCPRSSGERPPRPPCRWQTWTTS